MTVWICHKEWFGPLEGRVDRPPKWKSSIIKITIVKGLVAAKPWGSATVPLPSVSFRPVGWFTKLDAAYKHLDELHNQALYEETHCLCISNEQARVHPFIASYYNLRKKTSRLSDSRMAERGRIDLLRNECLSMPS